MATTARVIPFKRPTLPTGEPILPNLEHYLTERRAQRNADLDALRDTLRSALDEGAVRRALDALADLKRRVEYLEHKLSA